MAQISFKNRAATALWRLLVKPTVTALKQDQSTILFAGSLMEATDFFPSTSCTGKQKAATGESMEVVPGKIRGGFSIGMRVGDASDSPPSGESIVSADNSLLGM